MIDADLAVDQNSTIYSDGNNIDVRMTQQERQRDHVTGAKIGGHHHKCCRGALLLECCAALLG